MEITKKQFSEITRDIRIKNSLSQEALANKLHLGSKQSIYYYEKGSRIMKLPEFIDFIKVFDETVIINKEGMKLYDSNVKNERIETMNKNNFKFLEEKGEIKFYEDIKSGKEYQYIPSLGLTPVLEGELDYMVLQTYGDLSIRYNTNGMYGYSIWSGERCLEDNFWTKRQVEETLDELFFNVQKEKTISVIVNNVENKLEEEGLSLSDLDFDSSYSMLESLDDILNDGGVFRCEGFTDITIPYSLNFGELESPQFEEHSWECIDRAFDILKDNSLKSIVCRYSDYGTNHIRFYFEENINCDENCTNYKVILSQNNKDLVFKEFYFGLNEPSLDIVMSSILDDYVLYKNSPTLSDYICSRGEIDDIETDYKILKLDVEEMLKFFGREYLDNLID